MNKNKELHELLGLHWHEYMWKDDDTIPGGGLFECGCGHKTHFQWSFKINPDYASDPRLVLREMMKREDWESFQEEVCIGVGEGGMWSWGFHADLILDTTGKLRDLAIRWLKEGK